MKIRQLLFRAGALIVCLAIAATMMIFGRGHTVYLDNKTVEYHGQEYTAYYHVDVLTKRVDKAVKLDARDRGTSPWIGQSFRMDLTITETKGSQPVQQTVTVALPYDMDNPIINLPALLNGLPQEAWLDEFIPTPTAEDTEDTDVELGDGFDIDVTEDLG